MPHIGLTTLKAFIKPSTRTTSKRYNFQWAQLVQTILHGKFRSDRIYSRLQKSSDCNIVLKWHRQFFERGFTKFHVVDITIYNDFSLRIVRAVRRWIWIQTC